VSKPVAFTAGRKGQSIAITLGTLATCRWPVLIDLTDGTVHHLLQMKGKRLMVWKGLSATQAYYKIAKELTSDPRLMDLDAVDLDDVDVNDDGADKDLRDAKRIRLDLKVVSAMSEQLDSIIPFLSGVEKWRAAHDIISSHVAATAELEDNNGAMSFLSMFS